MHHWHVSNRITGAILPMRHDPALCSHISSGSSTGYAAKRPRHEVAKIVPLWRLSSKLRHAYAMPFLMPRCPFFMQAVRGHAAGGLDAAQRADEPDIAGGGGEPPWDAAGRAATGDAAAVAGAGR